MVGPRVKSYFLEYGLKKTMIDEFLSSYFKEAGYSQVTLYKTPVGYRLIIYAEYPGRFIGRGGSVLKKLTEIIQNHFGLENVGITVSPAPDPDLDARIVAFRIVRALEKEIPYRKVARAMLRRVMVAGASGAEIVISGKLRGERAKYEKFRAGVVYKSGESTDYIVDRAVAKALLKPGVLGVEVVIVKPGVPPPDHIELKPTEVKVEEKIEVSSSSGGGGSEA
ncbi:MAG: 30S ribosomal protein S3 [Desulfurococcaceae archaeon]|uniref:Small ribosomal subunit protein uS3 n=1 Tax=Staphylothermus marinus TaxID=2280 RepID=A0A7C4NNZ8_STAMA